MNAGWGGGLAHVQANSFKDLKVSPARLLVFKLGGTGSLPPMKPDQGAPPPAPPVRAPEAVVRHGSELFPEIKRGTPLKFAFCSLMMVGK